MKRRHKTDKLALSTRSIRRVNVPFFFVFTAKSRRRNCSCLRQICGLSFWLICTIAWAPVIWHLSEEECIRHKDLLQSITQQDCPLLFVLFLFEPLLASHCRYLIMQNETTTKAGTLKLCFEFVFLLFYFFVKRTKQNTKREKTKTLHRMTSSEKH